MNSADGKLKVAILQRVCPEYRIPLFTQLSQSQDVDVTLFIGEPPPKSKAKNSSNLGGINIHRMKTRFIRVGRRVFPWHVGLVRELGKLKPDVILCEGESHFLGYLQGIFYRHLINRRVGLMHWCFISLPGEEDRLDSPIFRIKAFFRRFFDAFVLYSSFSKERLVQLGVPAEKAFVATNVGNVKKQLRLADELSFTPDEARATLGLPNQFTLLFLGTLDANKHPEIMLDLARETSAKDCNFVLLGAGPLQEALEQRVKEEGLSNVFVCGRVGDELPLYLRASSALLIPGRGGIVISEAMAFRIPVVVHQADGTEHDLVEDQVTGIRLDSGSAPSFLKAIEYLRENPSVCAAMGAEARHRVESRFTTENMVNQIVAAARHAASTRNPNTKNT